VNRFAVLFPAAGRSTRFGDSKQSKVHSELDGRPVWLRAVEPFVNREDVCQLIIGVSPSDREEFERRYHAFISFINIQVVDGGKERHETVLAMLGAMNTSCDMVAIHDAARPCLQTDTIDAVFQAAIKHGAAIPGVPVSDTLKRVRDNGEIAETVPRAGLHAVQTPQAFRRDWLVEAYARRVPESAPTDDAQLIEAIGQSVVVVSGKADNIKITRREDLALAHAILAARPAPPRGLSRHPSADEAAARWDTLPKLNARDLFGA
jgi:2-C-methyl-D-erythritol 4-phosphate cytidylyltransferase